MTRVSPAVFNDELIAGDNMIQSIPHDGAHIIAVDRLSGELRWITQVDADPAAIITGSPVVGGNVVDGGVSSNGEALASSDAYPCCHFRGGLAAVHHYSGAPSGKTYLGPRTGAVTG